MDDYPLDMAQDDYRRYTVPDANATGQQAAQAAGVKPVAQKPADRWMAKAKGAQEQAVRDSFAPPPTPSAEEPDWRAYTVNEDAVNALPHNANRGAVQATVRQEAAAKAEDAAATQLRLNNLNTAAGTSVDTVSGFQDPIMRWKLATINNSTERAKYMSDNGFPARVVRADGQDLVVFQDKDGSSKTIRGSGGVGMGDVAAYGPATGRLGLEMLLMGPTRAASLPMKMLIQGAAGGGERMIEQTVNRLGGYNDQSISQDLRAAAPEAAAASAGEALGSLGQAFKNAVVNKNAGLLNPSLEGRDVLLAQGRLKQFSPEMRGVTPAAVGGGVIAARERQLAAMSNPLQNAYGDIRDGVAGLFQKQIQQLTGGASPAIGDGAATVNSTLYPGMEDILSGMSREAEAPLAGVASVSPTLGGQALQQGARELPKVLTDRLAGKFDAAVKAGMDAPDAENGVVAFDMNPMNARGAKISRGTLQQGRPREVTSIEEFPNAEGLGAPRTQETVSMEPTQVKLGGATPEIQAIIDKIKELNPELGVGPMVPGTDSPYEGVRKLTSQLSRASMPTALGASAEAQATAGQARELLGELETVLSNPITGAPADFLPKVEAAKNATKFRTKVLDTPQMQEAMHTMSPEKVMDMADPSNPTFIRTAKRVMDPKKFATFQDAYFTALTKEPEKLQAFMAAQRRDPTVAGIMLPPERKQLLLDYGAATEKLRKSPLQNMAAVAPDARPARLLDDADMESMADIITRGGGPESPIGKNMRAAVFQRALEGATKDGKVDFRRAANSIDNILDVKDGKSMAQSILTPEELERLTDVRTFTRAMGDNTGSGDMATSLKTGGVAANLGVVQAVLHPVKAATAMGDILESWAQSHLWKSESARQFLVNTGAEGEVVRAGKPARAAGAAVMQYKNSGRGQEPNVGAEE